MIALQWSGGGVHEARVSPSSPSAVCRLLDSLARENTTPDAAWQPAVHGAVHECLKVP